VVDDPGERGYFTSVLLQQRLMASFHIFKTLRDVGVGVCSYVRGY